MNNTGHATPAPLCGQSTPSADNLRTCSATPCRHDYEHPVRKGRARYHCRKCDADISMAVILLAEACHDNAKANLAKLNPTTPQES